MGVAAALALLTGILGVVAINRGGHVQITGSGLPRWIDRCAVLRPVVEPFRRVGFWGLKADFFRAQYVLAPVVLEVIDPKRRAPLPPIVVVDLADPNERAAALAWLDQTAARAGRRSQVREIDQGFVVVELRDEASGS
jgi:hypothetical protein